MTRSGRGGGGVLGAGAPPTRMAVLHSRQATTLPRSCSSTSMYFRQRGLGHCTANTPAGGRGRHKLRFSITGSASSAPTPPPGRSPRPTGRCCDAASSRAILPLVMSRAITSIRPLLPTPQRTCTGAPFGRLRRQPLDPAFADADAGVRLPRLPLQHLDAHLRLVLADGAVDPAGGGRQLRVLGDQHVVDAVLLLLDLDAEAVGVDVDLDHLAEGVAARRPPGAAGCHDAWAARMPACRAAPRATTSLTASDWSGALPLSSCSICRVIGMCVEPPTSSTRSTWSQPTAGLAEQLLRRQLRPHQQVARQRPRSPPGSAARSAPGRRACR